MIIIAATALPTTIKRIKFDFPVEVDVIFVELREVVSGDKSGFPENIPSIFCNLDESHFLR